MLQVLLPLPVGEVGQTEQNAYRCPFLVSRDKTDIDIFDEFIDPLGKSLFGILRAQVSPFQKVDIFFGGYSFFFDLDHINITSTF